MAGQPELKLYRESQPVGGSLYPVRGNSENPVLQLRSGTVAQVARCRIDLFCVARLPATINAEFNVDGSLFTATQRGGGIIGLVAAANEPRHRSWHAGRSGIGR